MLKVKAAGLLPKYLKSCPILLLSVEFTRHMVHGTQPTMIPATPRTTHIMVMVVVIIRPTAKFVGWMRNDAGQNSKTHPIGGAKTMRTSELIGSYLGSKQANLSALKIRCQITLIHNHINIYKDGLSIQAYEGTALSGNGEWYIF